jgi:hypothetical protein
MERYPDLIRIGQSRQTLFPTGQTLFALTRAARLTGQVLYALARAARPYSLLAKGFFTKCLLTPYYPLLLAMEQSFFRVRTEEAAVVVDHTAFVVFFSWN